MKRDMDKIKKYFTAYTYVTIHMGNYAIPMKNVFEYLNLPATTDHTHALQFIEYRRCKQKVVHLTTYSSLVAPFVAVMTT